MKKVLILLLIIQLSNLFIAAKTKVTLQQQTTVFNRVVVIDMTGAPAKADMAVVITGSRISAIGKAGKVRVPKGATLIDARGKYLIPGLWDMHVHLEISGKDSSFPLYIANGVTGVRDMGGDLSLIKQWQQQTASGNLLAPQIVTAGQILDGKTPGFPLRITVENASEGRKAVVSLNNGGADFIKVHNFLSREAYFAIADEAKKQGIPFAGHVPISVTAAEASNAGQKSIEHLSNLPGTFDDKNASDLFALFVKNNTWHCPTFVVGRSLASLGDSNFTNDPRLKYIPVSVKKEWDTQINLFFKKRTPEQVAAAEVFAKQNLLKVRAMHRAKVEFMTGTDVGFPFIFPGFSLHNELEQFVQAGLTPMETLQLATRNPAKYLGLLNSTGTVEKGKAANLILLEANPLENIGNTRKIAAVMVNGKLLLKEVLQEMLSSAEIAINKN